MNDRTHRTHAAARLRITRAAVAVAVALIMAGCSAADLDATRDTLTTNAGTIAAAQQQAAALAAAAERRQQEEQAAGNFAEAAKAQAEALQARAAEADAARAAELNARALAALAAARTADGTVTPESAATAAGSAAVAMLPPPWGLVAGVALSTAGGILAWHRQRRQTQAAEARAKDADAAARSIVAAIDALRAAAPIVKNEMGGSAAKLAMSAHLTPEAAALIEAERRT